eukprot:6947729-Alexandrium_andersonii.AAC.1
MCPNMRVTAFLARASPHVNDCVPRARPAMCFAALPGRTAPRQRVFCKRPSMRVTASPELLR